MGYRHSPQYYSAAKTSDIYWLVLNGRKKDRSLATDWFFVVCAQRAESSAARDGTNVIEYIPDAIRSTWINNKEPTNLFYVIFSNLFIYFILFSQASNVVQFEVLTSWSSPSLTFNVTRMRSIKDHTLFHTPRQCWTVPSFQNDNWLHCSFVYFHWPDALSGTKSW